MKNTINRSAIDRLRSIQTAEQYLIARTHAELDRAAVKPAALAFGQPIYKSALAIGVTVAVVWVLQIGFIREMLTVTV